MCFAYCIAAYLLRREAAARRAREVGISATPAPQTPSDEPPIPPELVGLAEHVTQQLQYDAAFAANPDAASYLTPPPIWPPPKPSLAPPTDLEGPEERGFADETEATTVFDNDGVVYPESCLPNPFTAKASNLVHFDRPNQYKPHFARFGLDQLQYPVNPLEVGLIEDQLKLKINVFSFFDDLGLARYPLYLSEKPYSESSISSTGMNTSHSSPVSQASSQTSPWPMEESTSADSVLVAI